MFDIDIDFADRTHALKYFDHIPAAIKDQNTFKKHNTGVYFQNIPFNPVTGLSTIDYKEAAKRGYFKIDFLNVSIYQDVKNEDHLIKLMNTEPIWELLEQQEFVDLLFHVNGHSNVLKIMKPKSIEQLAAVLAMIRPAKRHLIGKDWATVLAEVWQIDQNETKYAFKRSHSFSYAMAVVVHMNLICEKIDEQIRQLENCAIDNCE